MRVRVCLRVFVNVPYGCRLGKNLIQVANLHVAFLDIPAKNTHLIRALIIKIVQLLFKDTQQQQPQQRHLSYSIALFAQCVYLLIVFLLWELYKFNWFSVSSLHLIADRKVTRSRQSLSHSRSLKQKAAKCVPLYKLYRLLYRFGA